MNSFERDSDTSEVSSPSRILVVEDDEVSRLLATEAIEGAGRLIEEADTLEAARRALDQREFDAVVLDLILPDGDGRHLLAEIRERPGTIDLPVVILSARGGRASQVECFRLGADEFFEKPFDPEIVAAAVARQLERNRGPFRSPRRDDAPPDLERAGLIERFRELSARSLEDEHPLTVAHIQIDCFRSLDEESRSQTHTALLEALSRALRPGDSVGRWEDGEMVILFPDTDAGDARTRVDRALDDLDPGPHDLLGISATVAGPPQPETLREAVLRADRALVDPADGSDQRVALMAEEWAGKTQDGPGPRVLMVEDDEMTSTLVRHRFEREGMLVDQRTRASEAFTLLSASDPADYDLILLDVKLPGMGGFELLEGLRGLPRWEETPVIMLTGMGRDEDVVRAFELGADDYVLKPFSPVELLARVQRLLRKR